MTENQLALLCILSTIIIILIGMYIVNRFTQPDGIYDNEYINKIFNKYIDNGVLSYQEKHYLIRAIKYSSSLNISYYNHTSHIREVFVIVTPKAITIQEPSIIKKEWCFKDFIKYNRNSFNEEGFPGLVLTDLLNICNQCLKIHRTNISRITIDMSYNVFIKKEGK